MFHQSSRPLRWSIRQLLVALGTLALATALVTAQRGGEITGAGRPNQQAKVCDGGICVYVVADAGEKANVVIEVPLVATWAGLRVQYTPNTFVGWISPTTQQKVLRHYHETNTDLVPFGRGKAEPTEWFGPVLPVDRFVVEFKVAAREFADLSKPIELVAFWGNKALPSEDPRASPDAKLPQPDAMSNLVVNLKDPKQQQDSLNAAQQNSKKFEEWNARNGVGEGKKDADSKPAPSGAGNNSGNGEIKTLPSYSAVDSASPYTSMASITDSGCRVNTVGLISISSAVIIAALTRQII